MALATLSIDLEAKLASLERDFSRASRLAEDNARRMQASYAGVGKTFEELGATIAGAVGVNFTVSLIQGAIDAQDKLKDLSKSTSLTVEQLAGLSSLANKSGTDIDGLAASINKLSVNMGKDAEKFAKIGIDAKDPIEAFKQLADIYNAIEDPQQRAAFAAEALGKSWQSAAPALSEGGKSIGELIERGQKLSGITKESAGRADELNDNIADLKGSVSGLATAFANSLVPSLNDTTKAMTESIEKGDTLYALLRGYIGLGKLPWDAMLGDVDMSQGAFQKDLENTLATLEVRRKEVEANGGLLNKWLYGSKEELDQKILVTRNQLEALKKFGDKLTKSVGETLEETSPKPSRKRIQRFIDGDKELTDPHANDFSKLIQSLNEKIAVQTEDLQSVEKLTQAQKDYAKFQADIASGAVVLTESQKAVAGSFWEVYLARTKLNESEKANEKAGALVDDYKRGNAIILERIAREQELALMTDRQRAIAEALYRVEDDGQKIRERIIHDIQDETAQKLALAKAEEELAVQKNKVAEATARSFDQQRTFEFGWRKAFQSYQDNATDAARSAQEVFQQASSAMEDALTRFAMTGKLSFSSLANSIIADIVRMQAERVVGIMGSLGNWVGSLFGESKTGLASLPSSVNSTFAKGGVFENSPSLSAYSGRVYDSPQPFLFAKGAGVFGEAGPEAIMPLKRGRDGKLGVASDGGASVTVNVINNTGAQTRQTERPDGRGGKIIDVLIEQVEAKLAGNISTGSGPVPAALQSSYGLNRTAGAY